jgi:hypothetical protein
MIMRIYHICFFYLLYVPIYHGINSIPYMTAHLDVEYLMH